MKEFWNKYQWYIIIGALILTAGAFAFIYYVILAKGKALGTSSVLATIPNPSVGDPYTDQEKLAIRTYTTWLESDLAHWWSIHNDSQWANLAVDTDRILIGCSNQYEQDTPGASLYSDIEATTFLTTSDPTTVCTRLKALLGL